MARDVTTDLISHLRSHIDTSNISVSFSTSDDIGYAAYDDVEQEVYITPVSEDPVIPGGGQTRYSGLDPGGDGGIQDVITSVQIDCWGGDRESATNVSASQHPHQTANELGREVHRVLFETDDGATGPAVPSNYDWVNAAQPREANDIEESPTIYRRVVVARWKHTETP